MVSWTVCLNFTYPELSVRPWRNSRSLDTSTILSISFSSRSCSAILWADSCLMRLPVSENKPINYRPIRKTAVTLQVWVENWSRRGTRLLINTSRNDSFGTIFSTSMFSNAKMKPITLDWSTISDCNITDLIRIWRSGGFLTRVNPSSMCRLRLVPSAKLCKANKKKLIIWWPVWTRVSANSSLLPKTTWND